MTRKTGGLPGARAALLGAAPAGSMGAPAWFLDRFELRSDGLFLKARDEKPAVWLSAPFVIEAETRDPEGRGWGLLISWHDRDGSRHEEAFARATFSNECGEVRTRLADAGLSLNLSMTARQAFAEYLNACGSQVRAQSVSRIGWHQLGDRLVFVLPGQVFGQMAERVIFQTSDREPILFNPAGEPSDWQINVAALCPGNSRLMFAVSCAFAAPLLRLVGEEGGGFNLLGGSRIGKSTLLRAAASVWGGAQPGGAGAYIRQWRATANGLESVAVGSCDTLLCLDETGQVDAREFGDIAYLLANGQGKSRASRSGAARAAATWLLLFLSTGEKSLVDINAEAGKATKAGQEVRLADVPADAGMGFGCFEDVHGAASAAAFADDLRDSTGRFYGTAAPAFLAALVARIGADGAFAETVRERAEALRATWLRMLPEAGGQVLSVGLRFALVAIAGELAGEFNITGWPKGTASAGVERCFRAWLAERGTIGAREDEQAVTQLRDFILAHGASRFELWQETDDAQQSPSMPPERFRSVNRAGWRRAICNEKSTDGPTWVYYITVAAMNEALKGLSFRDATKLLVAKGYLMPDSEGKASRSISPPGHSKVRCYVVSRSLSGAGRDVDD